MPMKVGSSMMSCQGYHELPCWDEADGTAQPGRGPIVRVRIACGLPTYHLEPVWGVRRWY